MPLDSSAPYEPRQTERPMMSPLPAPAPGERGEDLAAMRRALVLASAVRTSTAPNPWVGCVVAAAAVSFLADWAWSLPVALAALAIAVRESRKP